MTLKNHVSGAVEPARPFNPSDHMMKLTGKDYLPVAARIAWLSAEFGHDVSIRTELLKFREWQELDPKSSKPGAPVMRTVTEALFQATITFPNGHVITAHGSESSKDFGDFIEKAETKSLGRALGYAGYGTLQAPEFDESATIARAASRNAAQENTYDNTRAVDTAQDLGKLKKPEPVAAVVSTPAVQEEASAPIPTPTPAVTTGLSLPVSAPSAASPAPAPALSSDLADMTADQLKQRLLQHMAQAKGKEPLQQQVNETVAGASQAGGVKKAGDLPIEKLRDLVQAVAEMVQAAVPVAA